MRVDRLHEILAETTVQLRTGPIVQAKGAAVTFDLMPHVDEAPHELVKVDLDVVTIGVDQQKALTFKPELVEILKTYPRPERLAEGPSYIEVGAEVGDQGAALCLFALGQVLELWIVITPTVLGFKGAEIGQMAGHGFIMITGFKGR